MQRQPITQADTAERPGSLLALAVWAGIVTGFGELAKIGVDLFYSDFVDRSRDAVWMIPAFDAGLFVFVGLLLVLLRLRVRVSWWLAAGLFAGLGTGLVLLLIEQLHPLAAVTVAAGVGTQTSRLVQSRVSTAARLVRRTLPWLVGSVAVLGVVTVGWRLAAERTLMRVRPAAGRGTPNVLLLILDTVRAAELSLYGYPRRTTPELERLAEGGTVFDRAFSTTSWTLPSHASIFTGEWEYNLDATWWDRLGPHWPTLAEALQARGYATAAFIANTEYVGRQSGLARGFAHYDDYPVTLWTAVSATAFGRVVYPWLHRPVASRLRRLPLLRRLRLPHPKHHRSAEEISASFLAWVDQAGPTPFFAFLNFMDAHTPYTPPDSFLYRYRSQKVRPISRYAWSSTPPVRLTPADVRPKQDMYDGSIAYLDSQLGRLFRELEHRGLLQNTLVVVTADHGDEFAEHGFVDHGNTLYRLSVHVPLVLWFPDRVPQGRRVAQPVSLRNLAATVLELAVPGPPRQPGRSLARFWMGGGDTTPDTIVTSVRLVEGGKLTSIALGRWRYIRNEELGTEELYEFEHDILERWNMADSDSGRRLLPLYRAAVTTLTTAPAGRGIAEGEPVPGRSRPMSP